MTASIDPSVRFGFRDYDTLSGRWTARDPILLESGQTNMYAYVNNNPIIFRDPCGQFCVGASVYAVVGIGGQHPLLIGLGVVSVRLAK